MLQLETLDVQIGRNNIIKQLNVRLAVGDIGCLLGPSGCGKTTLLRAIAGFEPVSSGCINLDNQCLSNKNRMLAPEHRQVGMVFQDFALFPHLTVFDNVAFGITKQSKATQRQRVQQLLEQVGLSDFAQRYPHQLSGGQQQRIALARALAPKPRLLLLDEPFSSLDAVLRDTLAHDMRQLIKTEGITALLVTHDQQEAFAMADYVGVMQHGQLLQWDTPDKLYHQPSCPFVARFIGDGEFLQGQLADGYITTALGKFRIDDESQDKQAVSVFVRPRDVLINANAAHQAVIVNRVFRGSHSLYRIALADNQPLFCMSSARQPYAIGETVGVELAITQPVYFPREQVNQPSKKALEQNH